MKKIAEKACSILIIFALSCVKSTGFESPLTNCYAATESNISFAEIELMYLEETIQIQEDLIASGYVISSDKAGNFYNVIYVQDRPNNPSFGLQLEVEQSQAHLFFPTGSKVFIKLKGLYLGKSNQTLKLGGTFTSFGNLSVGRLPALKVREHIFLACDEMESVRPTIATIPELDQLGLNTLVSINGLEVIDEELGSSYAIPEEETARTLQDCNENQISLVTSGFSDFQASIIPEGNGIVTGILQKDGDAFQLIIRDLDDIDLFNNRCPEIITEFTSNHIFISELADPNNNLGARFVELYNANSEALDLNQWILRRYTNDNTEVGSEIDLSGFILGSKRTLVISPNAEEFELVYGFPPDLGISTNSPADSNGDDNLELVDPFGKVIDVFGVVGEDGSGTNHEFEDGRAFRNPEVLQGNPTYTFSEWTVYNDTGEAGTINQAQNAPEAYSPGTRE